MSGIKRGPGEGDKGGEEYRLENNLRPGEAYSPGFFLVVVDTYNPSLLMFWFGTAALISGILIIKTMYDNNKLEEMSYAHGVVAKNTKNVEGVKMALDIFLGIIMVTVPAFAFVAFVAHVVSRL